jgi:hypothetical protein
MPICPCCGDETLNGQQIRRHLAARQRELADVLDAMNVDVGYAGPAPHNDGPAPYNAGPALHNDDPLPHNDDLAPRNNSPPVDEVERALERIHQRGIDLAALIAEEDDDFGK